MELDGFDGRVAIVTGGAGGIGRRTAETLLGLGARVAVVDVREPDVPGCLGVQMDVTDPGSVRAGVERVHTELGVPAVLVQAAGIFRIEPFEQTSLESWNLSIGVNLTGAFLVAQAVLPLMREAGYGRVVTLGSSAGITGGTKSAAAYGASKAGVMALAKAIATEYAPFGITSNALAPSLIETDMVGGIADLVGRIPVGRLGQPRDVADLIAFLCSEHSGFITGAVVDINGGFLIH
ncbi:SDR family NAD(P)-dependent oxidoreductase [Salinibacterium soli]|uniref:SDR family NAD(P)-dependent oxidoreductase n=1 Tax=Antiquaquibacter soli TaxID=3064523 RepID=A0ABT9BKM4_9MICO|nr:SDR family NAD(P)-dependent oxidoreductase [Protaetiibacter sp. WY-16]MDO7881568.1 SDR family NAD(P)-dependent oxidoreductase [Protaetiibacter sp. WY-16]